MGIFDKSDFTLKEKAERGLAPPFFLITFFSLLPNLLNISTIKPELKLSRIYLNTLRCIYNREQFSK